MSRALHAAGARADVVVRAAEPKDVAAIAALVAEFARRGDVLPRPAAAIRVTLRDWVVGVAGDDVVACGALFRYGAGLAEVRTTIVADAWQGTGLGRRIVEAVIGMAADRGIETVFTLTRRAPFFERLGFGAADKADFPEKVWKDCRTCPLIDACDETALRLDVIDARIADAPLPRRLPMSNEQRELFHHHLLQILYVEGLSGNQAFQEYCRVNAIDPSIDCPAVWRARKAIWASSG